MAVLETPLAGVDSLAGLRIIDCDAHFTEPSELWTSRAPKALKDRVPVQRRIGEETWWFLDDEPWANLGGNTIGVGRRKVNGTVSVQPFEEIDPCLSTAKGRVTLLDEQGIYAQVTYPNAIGFSSNQIFSIDDESQRLSVLQIYNDFLADVQEESNDRLFPQGILPIWDMDLTIKEMTRLIDRGIRGFTLSDKPEMLGLPELPEAYFDPMWDLFNESGTVPNFHIGSGLKRDEIMSLPSPTTAGQEPKREIKSSVPANWQWFGWQRGMAVMGTQMFMSNARIIINLCFSNLFDRYPKLKIVSAESGIGWIPFLLEAMDFQFREIVTHTDELALAKRRPSEYFHDHMFAMFWFETIGAERLLDAIGINNVLVETDVPHPTCFYPGAREHFAEVLSGISPEGRKRIVQDNAAELYRIPLPPND
jgi:predicted TIM-barrel fold metal-dependent hydrolase